MGSHFVYTVNLKQNVLSWPDDDRLLSKYAAIVQSIAYIILMLLCTDGIYFTIVIAQWDGLCQIHSYSSMFHLPILLRY